MQDGSKLRSVRQITLQWLAIVRIYHFLTHEQMKLLFDYGISNKAELNNSSQRI